ncbi:MAG: LON peptidase substrate-binding domain-containing protein [Verrucomicrobia bacterium]|nr:LON peptidase substrate-binding domain-containing protein [Verrucomicrobiota bacterium]
MKLPDAIAVMSLPNAVLFPQAVLPLHIFEPRYRAMLKDALAGDRMFSVALMREEPQPGRPEPEPCDVACAGLVRAAVRLGDGTSNVLLQGVSRVRLTGFLGGRPYRLATVEELPTSHTACAGTKTLVAKVAELVDLRHAASSSPVEDSMRALAKVRDPEVLADFSALLLLPDYRQRQEILETVDLRLRLRKLARLFQSEIDQLKGQRQSSAREPDQEFGPN